MRKEIIVPGLALAGGAVGFFLRRWELIAAFEPETGLPIPFAPSSMVIIAFSAVMAVVFLLLCRGKHSAFPGGYDQAFGAKGNTVYMTAMVLSAFLMLGAGLLMIWDFFSRANTQATRLILAVLTLVSFACVLAAGKNNYRGEGHGRYSFALLMPAYTSCMWLITAYQQRAGDPIRLDYIFELFAIIAALLGLYFTAGFSFERAKVFRAAFFSALGIYFSVTTLADAHDLAVTLLYVFLVVYLTANLAVLLANDLRFRDAVAPKPETPAEPTQLNDQTTEVIPDEQ